MIIYFVYFFFYIFIFILLNIFYFYLFICLFFIFFCVFYIYLCILLCHNFQISVNSLQQSSFHNFKFALQFFVSSAVSVDSSPLETVSVPSLTGVTEIHQLAGFMG